MYKLLVIITCIVVLTVHWSEFSDKVSLSKTLQVIDNVMEEVKE
jgi:hypothetical protein